MNLLAISGNATAGKNTCFDLLKEILKDTVELEPFQLADELKLDVCSFTKEKFGISSFTKNIEEKTLIRNILVETAEIRRKLSKGTYYTSILQPKIEESIRNNFLPCVNDLRFFEYEADEIPWVRKNKGLIIHVERYNGTEKIPPANKKEEMNENKLIENADYILRWQTSSNKEYLIDCCRIQLKDLIEKINIKYGIK